MAGLLQQPGARGGLLGFDMDRLNGLVRQATTPPVRPVQPQQPQRRGPGITDWLWGLAAGASPREIRNVVEADELADAERQRLEAMRPEIEARNARLAAAAQSMGSQAELAYYLNPERFGQEIAEQFGTDVLAEGSALARGGQLVAAAPVIERFDDRFGFGDPMGGPESVRFSAPRGPTERERIDRFEAENPVLGQGATWVGPNGQPRAQGYIPPVTVADAADLVDPQSGQPLYRNPAELPASASGGQAGGLTPQQRAEYRERVETNAREVMPSLTRMRELLRSRDVITGFGAEAQLQILRGLAAAGDEGAARRVAATEELRNLSGSLRVGMARLLGSNPSNADIRLLEQITSGDISQNAESLLRNVDALENRARQQSEDLARQLESTASSGGSSGEVVSVTTPEEAQRLPPGTRFRTPDGRVLVRGG
jgi:hypothetical protein